MEIAICGPDDKTHYSLFTSFFPLSHLSSFSQTFSFPIFQQRKQRYIFLFFCAMQGKYQQEFVKMYNLDNCAQKFQQLKQQNQEKYKHTEKYTQQNNERTKGYVDINRKNTTLT